MREQNTIENLLRAEKAEHQRKAPDDVYCRAVRGINGPMLLLKSYRGKALYTISRQVRTIEELQQTFEEYLNAACKTKYAPRILNDTNKADYYVANIEGLEQKFTEIQQADHDRAEAEYGQALNHYDKEYTEPLQIGPHKPITQQEIHTIATPDDKEWLFRKLKNFLAFQRSFAGDADAFHPDRYHFNRDDTRSVLTFIDSTHHKKTSLFFAFSDTFEQQHLEKTISMLLDSYNITAWQPHTHIPGTVGTTLSEETQYLAYADRLTHAYKHDLLLLDEIPNQRIHGPAESQSRTRPLGGHTL